MNDSELMRLEERIGQVTLRMAECHRVIRAAGEAQQELEQLRSELKKLTGEYACEVEKQDIRLIR